MALVQIKGVSKAFISGRKRINALRDVSIEVEEGEIFGILGPNGAGKTTLMNIMVGMLEPDAGEVRIAGKTLADDYDLLESMNYVSGESRFYWSLSPREILMMFAIAYNVPAAGRKERIEWLISELEIGAYADMKYDLLSTGQRVRLAIAKSLINNPRLLLLDEPTLGLDPHIAAKLRRLIMKLNQEKGITIILTSHYMAEVEELCKRIAFIHHGRVIEIGEVEKVKLRGLSGFRLEVELGSEVNRKGLIKMGFGVKGRIASKQVASDSMLNPLLSRLLKEGYSIRDVRIRRPSLEDYFIRMTDEGNQPGGLRQDA